MIRNIFFLTNLVLISANICFASIPSHTTQPSASEPEQEPKPEDFFNAKEVHGLNLKNVFKDQCERRSKGKGTGFSTLVVLYAGNQQKIADSSKQFLKSTDSYDKQRAILNDLKKQLSSTLNPFKRRQISKQISQKNSEVNTIEKELTTSNIVIKMLKETSNSMILKITAAAKEMGHPEITESKLSRIPALSEIPKEYNECKDPLKAGAFPPAPHYPAPPPPSPKTPASVWKSGTLPPAPHYPAPPPPAVWKKGTVSQAQPGS